MLKFIIIPPYYPTFQKFVNTQPQEERKSKYIKRIRGHYSHLITSETDPYAVPLTTHSQANAFCTIQVAAINQEADNRLNAFLSLPVTSHYSSCSCNNLAPHVPRSGEGGSVGMLRHERVGGQPRLIVISPQATCQQTVQIQTAVVSCQHHEVQLFEHDTCRVHRRSSYKNDDSKTTERLTIKLTSLVV